MSNLQTRLREMRKKNNLTQSDMAKLLRDRYNLKTDRVMISKWETGFQVPEVYTIACIADLFGVTMDYLNGKEMQTVQHDKIYKNLPKPTITEDFIPYPIIGEIAAGYDNFISPDWEGDYVDIPASFLNGRNKEDFFVLRIKGDSMYPQYQNGDKVLILKQSTLEYSGQIGAIIYDGDFASLKKIEYKMGEDWLRLIPINPIYPPEKIENERLEQCRILGVPKLLIREIDN